MCNAATVIKILFTFSGDVIDCPAFLQKGIQCFLVVVAFLCIPWMLIAKPLVLRQQYLKRKHLVSDYNFFFPKNLFIYSSMEVWSNFLQWRTACRWILPSGFFCFVLRNRYTHNCLVLSESVFWNLDPYACICHIGIQIATLDMSSPMGLLIFSFKQWTLLS